MLEHFGREQQRAAAAAATAAAALGKGKAPAVPKMQKPALGPDDVARCVSQPRTACQSLGPGEARLSHWNGADKSSTCLNLHDSQSCFGQGLETGPAAVNMA